MIDQPDKDAAAVPFRPTVISLFAGAGGCYLGFGQAGLERFNSPDFKPIEFDGFGNCGEFATIRSQAGEAPPVLIPSKSTGLSLGKRRSARLTV